MTTGPEPTPPPLTCYGCGEDWGTCSCAKKERKAANLMTAIFTLLLVTAALMVIA